MKSTGDIRMCIDIRKVNHNTEFDRYPNQNTEELLMKIEKSEYISTVDAVSGY